MEAYIRQSEKDWMRDAVSSGANAFQASQMANKIVGEVSLRTNLVGKDSVSIVMPAKGMVDTNLWRPIEGKIIGFIPRLIMPNGTIMGPSEFPVELNLISSGQLPKHSLFFKTILYDLQKKRLRSLMFRRRKGPKIPGILGLLMLALFGLIPEEYENFGLDENLRE